VRRLHQRKRKRFGDVNSRDYLERWKELRQSLASAIKAAKDKCWSDMIATVNNDIRSKLDKIVMKRLRKPRPTPGIELPGRLELIVSSLFPSRPLRENTNETHSVTTVREHLCTAEDVISATKTLPKRKAPGSDGINNEILRVAVATNLARFGHLFNRFLSLLCLST